MDKLGKRRPRLKQTVGDEVLDQDRKRFAQLVLELKKSSDVITRDSAELWELYYKNWYDIGPFNLDEVEKVFNKYGSTLMVFIPPQDDFLPVKDFIENFKESTDRVLREYRNVPGMDPLEIAKNRYVDDINSLMYAVAEIIAKTGLKYMMERTKNNG